MALLAGCAQYAWFEVARRWLPDSGALGVSALLSYGLMGWLALDPRGAARRAAAGLARVEPRCAAPLALLAPVSLVALSVEAVVHAQLRDGRAMGAWDWHVPVLAVSSDAGLLVSLAVVVVVMPLALEWFFRGIVLARLSDALGPAAGAVIASSAYAFAIAGLRTDRVTFLTVFAGSFVAGLVLSAVQRITGSLWAAFAVHAAGSGLHVLFRLLAGSLPVAFVSTRGRAVPLVIAVPSTVAVVAGLGLLSALRAEERAASDPPLERQAPAGGSAPLSADEA